MSYISDKLFVRNSSYLDTQFIGNNNNSVSLNHLSEFQFEPGVVLDIILDDSHPLFKTKKMGYIAVPSEHPINFENKQPSKDDLDYISIGCALIRLCYSQQKIEKENLFWIMPLENNFTTYPLLNEVVHVVKILDKYYYTNKINVKNWSNSSADFRYEQSYGKKLENVSYSGGKLDGPKSKLDSKEDVESVSYRGILGNYFWFNSRIRNLRRFEGDSIFESRFGQSIRMGAYDDTRLNDKGAYTDYKSGENNTYGGGNPMILIRNRQRPLAQNKKQSLHPLLNEISDISSSLNEKNVGGYMIEDINNDGSSIHITSGLTVSKFRTTCYKKYFSLDKSEEQLKFIPSGSTKFETPILNGDQIVIHSDRLIFSSRFEETMHFSKKRYMITTDSEYIVDAHDQIVLTTNQKTVINSPAIYLGEYDNTNEPVLLGQTTVDWLYDLCLWLEEHTHHYEHSHPDAGGAEPSDTQIPVQLKQLRTLRSKLHENLSRRVFVTGRGYSPGSDGNPIKDGREPLKINVINGDGVPGGFKGKNRRESSKKY